MNKVAIGTESISNSFNKHLLYCYMYLNTEKSYLRLGGGGGGVGLYHSLNFGINSVWIFFT